MKLASWQRWCISFARSAKAETLLVDKDTQHSSGKFWVLRVMPFRAAGLWFPLTPCHFNPRPKATKTEYTVRPFLRKIKTMISIRRKIESLERKTQRIPNLNEIPKRESPPTMEELLKLKRDLAMPQSVFDDLFGAENG